MEIAHKIISYAVFTLKYTPPAITAALTLLAKLHPEKLSLRTSVKSRAKLDYEFVERFMRISPEERHPLEIEHAAYAWLKQRLRYIDIMAILNFTNPSHAFHLFRSARQFVELDETGRYIYKTRTYAKKGMRTFTRWLFIAIYALCALLALYPLWLSALNESPISLGLLSIPVFIIFGMFALMALDYSTSLQTAETFMSEQDLRSVSKCHEDRVSGIAQVNQNPDQRP